MELVLPRGTSMTTAGDIAIKTITPLFFKIVVTFGCLQRHGGRIMRQSESKVGVRKVSSELDYCGKASFRCFCSRRDIPHYASYKEAPNGFYVHAPGDFAGDLWDGGRKRG